MPNETRPAAIEDFMRLIDKWGYVSWHLPHHNHYDGKNIFPEGFRALNHYVPRLVLPHYEDQPDADTLKRIKLEGCFNVLKHVRDDRFQLKVNRRGWGNMKTHISKLDLKFEPNSGPSLVAINTPMDINDELTLIEYRVHLTNGDKGLRDVLIWEDRKSALTPKPQYLTTYIWCFTKNWVVRPYAANREDDPTEWNDTDDFDRLP